ncbi:MAG TPA: hemerythrin domain-containing protein [Polyangiaceae bacterium]|nr:hemerythrin domain-containing protein [Polyangiaceae bacterium]
MLPSYRFRRQHEELSELVLEIDTALRAPAFPGNARAVRGMMARFKGKLVVHSSMENEALYPRLLAHADPTIRSLAQNLFDEFGGIYDAFAEHHGKWSSVELIEANPSAYARDTQAIFDQLKLRIGRENSELYPLVDREGIVATE